MMMHREPPEIFARIYARHGHRCPMSTLGGRLGLAVNKILSGQKVLQAVYGNRTCALDGIAETTGCSEQNGMLRVDNDGRHVLAVNTVEESIQVELTPHALEMAGRYRALCNRLERHWEQLDNAEQSRRRDEMDSMLDELLPQLWKAEDEILIRRVAGDNHA